MGEGLGLPPGVNAQPVLGMMSKSLLSFIDEQESLSLALFYEFRSPKAPIAALSVWSGQVRPGVLPTRTAVRQQLVPHVLRYQSKIG